MPHKLAMVEGARNVARNWNGGLYVHCANGHGRSSCFAALVIMLRGETDNWKEAFRMMKSHRKYINIQAPQKRMMDELQQLLQNEINAAVAANKSNSINNNSSRISTSGVGVHAGVKPSNIDSDEAEDKPLM